MFHITGLMLLAFVVGCAQMSGCAHFLYKPGAHIAPPVARDTHERLNGVLFVQTSAEYQTLSRAIYRAASFALDRAIDCPAWTAAVEQLDGFEDKPLAIVMDIDETVLDNSGFQGRLAFDRSGYNPDVWRQWVRRRTSTPVPGSIEFAQYARRRNVVVFYITNRDNSQEADTRLNLQALGFPLESSRDVVLTLGEQGWVDADKSARRAHVASTHRILLLVGDDLGDFVSGAKTPPEERVALARKFDENWGMKWILLPNWIYGSWETAIYGNVSKLPDDIELRRKFDALKKF